MQTWKVVTAHWLSRWESWAQSSGYFGSTVYPFYIWRIVRRVARNGLFPVAFGGLFGISFLLLYVFTVGGMNVFDNFVTNAYFWILTGVIFRLPSLARVYPT